MSTLLYYTSPECKEKFYLFVLNTVKALYDVIITELRLNIQKLATYIYRRSIYSIYIIYTIRFDLQAFLMIDPFPWFTCKTFSSWALEKTSQKTDAWECFLFSLNRNCPEIENGLTLLLN